MGRILLVTFQQALRSVALTLFPLSFIALFAWSTAGSATGNTTDPIRAALWLWLGGHLIPFDLLPESGFATGKLSYLPIGALVFIWLAIRSGYLRASEFLANPRGARSLLVFWYTVIATAAAIFSQNSGIKPNLLLTPIFSLTIALLATINFQSEFFIRYRFLTYSALALTGLATILIALAMFLNFTIVKSLAIVIQPGIVGGILFTFLQLLYLPNLALSALSYLFGVGFSLGNGTQISPLEFKLDSLPAIPVLGALPTSTHQLLLIALVAPAFLLILNQVLIFKKYSDFKARQSEVFKRYLLILPAFTSILYFAGGDLLTSDMSPIGVIWWKLPALFTVAIGALVIISLYLPKMYQLIRSSKSEL